MRKGESLGFSFGEALPDCSVQALVEGQTKKFVSVSLFLRTVSSSSRILSAY